MKFLILPLLFHLMCVCAYSQTAISLPRNYEVKKIKRSITVDGKLKKSEWKKAPWSTEFVDIRDSSHPAPRHKTRVKMLWNDEYLFVAAKLEEPDLWATLTQHDNIIYHDHDFEVFIDPNNDGKEYFEIEINALGTVMDLFMPKPYNKGGRSDLKWTATGLESAVLLKGTLNDNTDKDKYWTVEMAIPFESMKRDARIFRPQGGDTWRINFSRVQWTLEKTGKGYEPKKKLNGKRLPEDNWVWSPQGVVNMHIPDRWGYIKFLD